MNIQVANNIKQLLSMILILSGGTIITSCDSGTTSQPPATVTECITVMDDLDNSPLESASVQLTIRKSSGVGHSFYGTTNTSGECCFEYESPASIIDISVMKDGYVYYCGDFSSAIRLMPVAYLQFHVKNVPPTDNNDLISITSPTRTCSYSQFLQYEGANIDTTVTIMSRPGTSIISWVLWHNNVSTDSTFGEIVMTSHDTTYIQVLY